MSALRAEGTDDLDDELELRDVHWRTRTRDFLLRLDLGNVFLAARNVEDQVVEHAIAPGGDGVSKGLPGTPPIGGRLVRPHLSRQAGRAVPPGVQVLQLVELQLVGKRHAGHRQAELQLRVHQGRLGLDLGHQPLRREVRLTWLADSSLAAKILAPSIRALAPAHALQADGGRAYVEPHGLLDLFGFMPGKAPLT